MKLEYRYRNECDILRLLVDEFERMCERYARENKVQINAVEAYDAAEYHKPRCIENLKDWLSVMYRWESVAAATIAESLIRTP